MGPDNAKVVLVEFLDPECESCRAFSPYVKEIMNKYEGKVKLVVRYAAFHKNSAYAISILEAARKQGKYWETLDLLFKSQPAWGNHHNPRPDLIWNYLTTLDLDIDKIKSDMHDPKFMEWIRQDAEDGKALGVRGTPTFFINGKPLERFSYQQLELQIREELNK
ncbi:disulfide bond formation protein DsbA [Halobacteriovorax sp. DA5]|nr:disulfide bond formation protein DsbA [Halobacteriovorax sp. DA5]